MDRDPAVECLLGDLSQGGLALIDRLSPAEFLRELPDLLEVCAIEHANAIVRIDRANLPLLLRAMRAHLETATGGVAAASGMPHPDALARMMRGRDALEISMTRDHMVRFARELRSGRSCLADRPLDSEGAGV